jgi:hypothetical protein
MVQDALIFSNDFQRSRLNMAMITSMILSEVRNGNHKFHSMCTLRSYSTKWLLLNSAVKFHMKFGIILPISRPVLAIEPVI